MGRALYREHRPKHFDEVVGQDAIIRTLKNAIKSGRVSHAYLFTGPRGVGKTSVARILAHEVNKLPYTDDSIHLDIIEIDAASNRRIDEIRELRDKVHISPTSAKYKVYIIDEVHMLTREAFNALLKTLEEPPEHCIFILATTEAHKVPETIVSRTQRFEFKPISKAGAASQLTKIAAGEQISIDGDAVELLAEHGGGSFRDSISLLDQISGSSKKISAETVRQFLGLPPQQAVDEILKAAWDGNSIAVLDLLEGLSENGYDPASLAKMLAKKIRDKAKAGELDQQQIVMLRQLVRVPASLKPEEELEIILLEQALANTNPEAPQEDSQAKTVPEVKPAEAEVAAPKTPTSPAKRAEFDEAAWSEIVTRAKGEAASLYTALRLATPSISGNTLTLSFQFPLHQRKINQTKNKDLVAKIIHEVIGKDMVIETAVGQQPPAPKPKTGKELNAISNIFGTAEVLES